VTHATADDGHRRSTWGDRRHLSVTETVSLVILVLQLAAIVWGAATLKASVDTLKGESGATRVDVANMASALQSLTVDVRLLQQQTRRKGDP
jgi:hypothetical protein